MHYAEWKAVQEGKPTIRGQVRAELDEIIKSAYTMKAFWEILRERGYEVHRSGVNITHTSFVPPFGKRPIRFSNLGEGYTLEDIQKRITAARNGIRAVSSEELPKPHKYKGILRNAKRKKLKGFTALYFHYLYFFGRIQKKQTPQRVSFFMREELIKLERYQKQFHFLLQNNIETTAELSAFQKEKEGEIDALIEERTKLYAKRTENNVPEIKQEAEKINTELRAKRAELGMCSAIFLDAYRIAEKYQKAKAMEKTAEMEVKESEHKRRGRGFNG